MAFVFNQQWILAHIRMSLRALSLLCFLPDSDSSVPNSHELYVYADTYDMYTNFVPHLRGRYLSSNVNITVFNSDGVVESVPVGNRYTKFTTRKGRNVTSLGVLYNFYGNDVNTTVQTVANMVKEEWVGGS
ncbi:hypothetical protein BU15DRAFT_69627, partial [Melanogaster broomeanus]